MSEVNYPLRQLRSRVKVAIERLGAVREQAARGVGHDGYRVALATKREVPESNVDGTDITNLDDLALAYGIARKWAPHIALCSELAPEVKSLALMELDETKVRRVRNSAYWGGVPRGTPITPGMKPKRDWGTFWHGTPSGDLRGGKSGLHVGTREAAREALNARIGRPADGRDWDGTREYGKTPLAGYHFGYGVTAPDAPTLPTGAATYGDGTPVPMDAKPDLFPVRITGPMTNTPDTAHPDFYAGGYMRAQISRGRARSGYFYRNVGEDAGSISAVVPNGGHLERVVPDDAEDDSYRLMHQAPRASDDVGAPLHDLEDVMPDVYEHPEYYITGDEPGAHEAVRVARAVRGKPDAMVRVYRAMRADAAHHGIRDGDWVTTAYEYARQHAGRHGDDTEDYDQPVISAMVPARSLYNEGYLTEYGYNGTNIPNADVSFEGGRYQRVHRAADGRVRPVGRTMRLEDQFRPYDPQMIRVPEPTPEPPHPLSPDELDAVLEDVFHPQQLEARREIHPKSGYPVQVGLERRLDHTSVPDTAIAGPLSEWSKPAQLVVRDYGQIGDHWYGPPKTVGHEPLQYVYRAMGMPEYNQAVERGYIQSDARGAITVNEGTNAALEPDTAVSYLPHGRHAMVLKIKAKPEHDWRMIHADNYVRTANPIPMSDVVHAEPFSGSKEWRVYHGHPDPAVLDDERHPHKAASTSETKVSLTELAIGLAAIQHAKKKQREADAEHCPHCGHQLKDIYSGMVEHDVPIPLHGGSKPRKRKRKAKDTRVHRLVPVEHKDIVRTRGGALKYGEAIGERIIPNASGTPDYYHGRNTPDEHAQAVSRLADRFHDELGRDKAAKQAVDAWFTDRFDTPNPPASKLVYYGDPVTSGPYANVPVQAHSREEYLVHHLVEQWAQSSGATKRHPSAEMTALQLRAKALFGLDARTDYFDTRNQDRQEQWSPLYDAYLRTVYASTQDDLRRAGLSHLTLFRGMHAGKAVLPDYFPADTGNGVHGDIPFDSQPLSSWSTSRVAAADFATDKDKGRFQLPFVATVTVPAARVFSTALTGFGAWQEREVVLLGGPGAAYLDQIGGPNV